MKGEVIMDSKRRIVLPKEVEETHGARFIVINLPTEVLLKPVPKDPLKAAQKEWEKKMKGVSIERFEKEVEDYAKRRIK